MPVFLLNLANADFAAGKGPYPVMSGRRLAFVSAVARIAVMLGAALTLAAAATYFYQANAKERLLSSLQTVTATVSGCAGPGRFQNIRFHYTVEGKAYDQSAYWRGTEFVGPSGLTDACTAPTIRLNYLAGDPNRWSVAPISPITRQEREATTISAFYVIIGPFFLFVASIFSLTGYALRKTKEKQERLAKEGVILKAELIKAKEDTTEDSPFNIRCEYRFTNPRGEVLTGKTSGIRPDVKKKDYPPPGTPMLVLYVNDHLFEAL